MATYKILGMDCAEEVGPLRRELEPLVRDPERLALDVLNGTLTVDLSAEVTDDAIRSAVARTGMKAEPCPEGRSGAGAAHRRQRLIGTAVSGMGVLAAIVLQAWSHGTWRAALDSDAYGAALPSIIAAAIAIIAGVWQVLPKAISTARHLRPDMNLLMVVAVIGAAAIGEWLGGAMVAFFFAVSLALESWSVGRARRAVGLGAGDRALVVGVGRSRIIAHLLATGAQATVNDLSPAAIGRRKDAYRGQVNLDYACGDIAEPRPPSVRVPATIDAGPRSGGVVGRLPCWLASAALQRVPDWQGRGSRNRVGSTPRRAAQRPPRRYGRGGRRKIGEYLSMRADQRAVRNRQRIDDRRLRCAALWEAACSI